LQLIKITEEIRKRAYDTGRRCTECSLKESSKLAKSTGFMVIGKCLGK